MLIQICMWILDHFTIALSGILCNFLPFLIQSAASFCKLGKMTNANKTMNLYHFLSDPADMWICIRIIPKIQIRILDHVWLTFWPVCFCC